MWATLGIYVWRLSLLSGARRGICSRHGRASVSRHIVAPMQHVAVNGCLCGSTPAIWNVNVGWRLRRLEACHFTSADVLVHSRIRFRRATPWSTAGRPRLVVKLRLFCPSRTECLFPLPFSFPFLLPVDLCSVSRPAAAVDMSLF